jgi:hypothetical protein
MTLNEQYKEFLLDNDSKPLLVSDMLNTPWASCPDCGYTLGYDLVSSGRIDMCNVYCEDCDFTEETIN